VAPTQLASLAFGGGQVIQFWAFPQHLRDHLWSAAAPRTAFSAPSSRCAPGMAGRFTEQVAEVTGHCFQAAWPAPGRHVAVRPDQHRGGRRAGRGAAWWADRSSGEAECGRTAV